MVSVKKAVRGNQVRVVIEMAAIGIYALHTGIVAVPTLLNSLWI